MGKQIKNRLFISFVTLIILMMSILTGKAYADETVDNKGMVNNWYVINNNYGSALNGGGWFFRYENDWATYCSQNGAPLNDSSYLASTNPNGLIASPDAALILSAIKNWSIKNTYLNNTTLFDILTNNDDIERKTELPDYSKGTGYGYIQNAWWLTDEGKSAVNEQGNVGLMDNNNEINTSSIDDDKKNLLNNIGDNGKIRITGGFTVEKEEVIGELKFQYIDMNNDTQIPETKEYTVQDDDVIAILELDINQDDRTNLNDLGDIKKDLRQFLILKTNPDFYGEEDKDKDIELKFWEFVKYNNGKWEITLFFSDTGADRYE